MNYKIVIRIPAINALYDITLYNGIVHFRRVV